MKLISNITTPVYLKTEKSMEWPKDKLFYILSSNGLFLCRNHEWFKSCAPAKKGPGELEEQEPFATLDYPRIPRLLLEKAVGFFRAIEEKKHWESALILVWNRTTEQMELVCPDQKAGMASVKYDIPKLPQHLALIGDIHAHPTFSPTPSMTDDEDEVKRPGLHIIAGYITGNKPQFHCVVVIDGERFTVKYHDIMEEEYMSSDPSSAPQEWLDKVKPLYKEWTPGSHYDGDGYYGGGGYGGYNTNATPDNKDKHTIEKVLRGFMHCNTRPIAYEVRQELFRKTKVTGYVWCETRADEFIKEWDKAHEKTETQSHA